MKNEKMVPEKVGLKGIQRDGIEYELTILMKLNGIPQFRGRRIAVIMSTTFITTMHLLTRERKKTLEPTPTPGYIEKGFAYRESLSVTLLGPEPKTQRL